MQKSKENASITVPFEKIYFNYKKKPYEEIDFNQTDNINIKN